MKTPRRCGLRQFRRFCQLAAVGVALCLALLAESALACPVWIQFYRISDEAHGTDRRRPLHHITSGKERLVRNGIRVTVQSFRPGQRNIRAGDPQLVIKNFSYGGYGVRPASEHETGANPEGYRAGAVGRGESLFLSFDREVTLLAAVHFGPLRDENSNPRRGKQDFRGRDAGDFYTVRTLSEQGDQEVGSVDPLVPYRGAVPEGTPPGKVVPRGDGDDPVLARVRPAAGQTVRGRIFELRVPDSAAAEKFRWYLGGLLVQPQACLDDPPPVPEPSTALLLAAGLAALGYARAGRRA